MQYYRNSLLFQVISMATVAPYDPTVFILLFIGIVINALVIMPREYEKDKENKQHRD